MTARVHSLSAFRKKREHEKLLAIISEAVRSAPRATPILMNPRDARELGFDVDNPCYCDEGEPGHLHHVDDPTPRVRAPLRPV